MHWEGWPSHLRISLYSPCWSVMIYCCYVSCLCYDLLWVLFVWCILSLLSGGIHFVCRCDLLCFLWRNAVDVVMIHCVCWCSLDPVPRTHFSFCQNRSLSWLIAVLLWWQFIAGIGIHFVFLCCQDLTFAHLRSFVYVVVTTCIIVLVVGLRRQTANGANTSTTAKKFPSRGTPPRVSTTCQRRMTRLSGHGMIPPSPPSAFFF